MNRLTKADAVRVLRRATMIDLVNLLALKAAEELLRGSGSQSYTAEASLGGSSPTAVVRVRITRMRVSAPRQSRKGAA